MGCIVLQRKCLYEALAEADQHDAVELVINSFSTVAGHCNRGLSS